MKLETQVAILSTLAAYSLLTSCTLVCDTGYALFDQYCYRLSKDAELYAEAVTLCNAENAHLVSIHDATENDFLLHEFTGEFLIGLKYQDDTKTYNWSDGTQLDYTNYTDTFVAFRLYFGSCAKMNAEGKWANVECGNDKLSYVCRKKAEDVSSSDSKSCPDPLSLHIDHGQLTSPGYPGKYDGSSVLNCTYKLMAMVNYVINVRVAQADLGNDTIFVYKLQNSGETSLAATVTNTSLNVSTIIHSNLLLVVFTAAGTGSWKLDWDSVETKPVCEYVNQYYTAGDWCFFHLEDWYASNVPLDNNHCMFYYRAEIPSIHNQDEEAVLSSMVPISPKFPWQILGLTHHADGKYKWLDETAFDYSKFRSDYQPSLDPSQCIFNVNGEWVRSACGTTNHQLVCKKIVARLPITQSGCVDAHTIYEGSGEVSSPGYPNSYSGEDLFGCKYYLTAKEGYLVHIYFTALSDSFQTVRVYNKWDEDEDHLLAVLQKDYKLLASNNGSNTVLIVHDALQSAWWTISWYSTKDPTYIPSRTERNDDSKLSDNLDSPTPQPNMCYSAVMGILNGVYYQMVVTSPGFPSGYDKNQDCVHYSNSTYSLPKNGFWRIDFVRLRIGHDDYIRLVDLRTNTVFATTDTNIREGLALATTFDFAIEFHSGNIYSSSDQWRILQRNHD